MWRPVFLEVMARVDPDVATGFHRWIAAQLSERLALTTKTIEALQSK
jgi:hypothetical protein